MSSSPLIDRRHLDFLLYDVLQIDSLGQYPRYAEHSRDTFDAAIDLAHKIAIDQFLSHYQKADQKEPALVNGRVEIIPEIKAALQAYSNAGFMAELADQTQGGMQLPYVVSLACDGMFLSANASTTGYIILTRGAMNLLFAHGSEEQKERYARPMLEGRWFGTMCLSEPQAGSSLSDIKCVAEPQADGSYRLQGAKMWISGGEHDITENIVHLVLARLPDAPPGVRGISLFIVPRHRLNADGSLGERNDVKLAGVNHKMGQRALINCFLKFGEENDCYGELVGKPHQGLACMFHMMNEARIDVGLGSVHMGWASYLYSLKYAHERLQGRHPDQKDGASKPLRVIEHADVRRMLLQQKAYIEGCHALVLYVGLLLDRSSQDPDKAVRHDAHLLVEFLTPIVKAWSSDLMLKANDLAIQILGGYGYTREYPVEQTYRDNRINPIHEGTNGIQAIDLMGRKTLMEQGGGVRLFLDAVRATANEASDSDLSVYGHALSKQIIAIENVVEIVSNRLGAGEARATLSNANAYLQLLGHTALAWMWAKQALASSRILAEGAGDAESFQRGKLQACAYFFRTELPQTEVSLKLLRDNDRTSLDMRAEWF